MKLDRGPLPFKMRVGPVKESGRWPWLVSSSETEDAGTIVATGEARSRYRAEWQAQRAAERVNSERAIARHKARLEREASEGYWREVWS